MIKKLNIVLAILFAVMFALKGLKEIKADRDRNAAANPVPAKAAKAQTELAPNVYYVHWTYFAAEDPISKRTVSGTLRWRHRKRCGRTARPFPPRSTSWRLPAST